MVETICQALVQQIGYRLRLRSLLGFLYYADEAIKTSDNVASTGMLIIRYSHINDLQLTQPQHSLLCTLIHNVHMMMMMMMMMILSQTTHEAPDGDFIACTAT